MRYTLYSIIYLDPAYLFKLSFHFRQRSTADLGPWLLTNTWLFHLNQSASFISQRVL